MCLLFCTLYCNCSNYLQIKVFIHKMSFLCCWAAACAHGADVVFLLDASGSVGRKVFQSVTRFVALLIETLAPFHSSDTDSGPASRVGLAVFADSVSLKFHLDRFSDKDDALHAVNVKYLGGATCTDEALRSE